MSPSRLVWRLVQAAMLRASRTRAVVMDRAAFQPNQPSGEDVDDEGDVDDSDQVEQ